jgi:adenylosuccinate lyase
MTLSLDPAFTAATQWLERTLDDSANRRIAIPEAYLGIDAILLLLHNVSAGLVVRPAVIRRRLLEELPFLATEAILMRSVVRGGDRQSLHERIRQHSVAAAERLKEGASDNDLVERIVNDAEFGLREQEIRDTLDPARHIGRAPEQVDNFLRDHVDPILEGAAESAPVPELRA